MVVAAAAIAVTVTMGVMMPILTKLATLMGNKYKKIKELRKEVSFLNKELTEMNVLLKKMEEPDDLDTEANNWRKFVVEMSYDIEDCIDDFMNHVADEDKVGRIKKACHILRTHKRRRLLSDRLQEIKITVIEASARRKRNGFDQFLSNTTRGVKYDPRLSSPYYKDSASLVGVDSQKEELVQWVLGDGDELKVMSIVGFGGLGKTTLANEVYQKVGGQFNCKAFVSISQKPEIERVLNSVLYGLGQHPPSQPCLVTDLINNIREQLSAHRYFIVIDDLWNIEDWNTIGNAFPPNNLGSRVMITTRNEDVARNCYDKKGSIHNMKPLSEQDSRKLFFNRIFGSEDGCPSEFTGVSIEILKKCRGLPLAIITIASILACQHHKILKQHWEQDKKLKKLWEYIQKCLSTSEFGSESALKDMMYILNLSYISLPRHLKSCFLYLGNYPEDHKISRVELVRLWVAEGFVSNSLEPDVWDVTDSYFNELLNRSMIQPVYEDDFGIEVLSCRVHDMMLDLILSKQCREYNFVNAVHGLQAMGEVQNNNVRRLSVDLSGKNEDVTMPTSNLLKLRYIAIFGGSKLILHVVKLKYLRILSLEFPKVAVLDLAGISQLSQLKYLKVKIRFWRLNGLECNVTVPAQMKGLRHLQTLEIPYNPVSNIPSDIAELPSLSHLDLVLSLPHDAVSKLPDGIGKMKFLRTLRCKGFYLLSNSSPENIKSLSELTNLTELELDCGAGNLGRVPTATWMAALKSSLEKLANLERLSLVSRSACCVDDAISSFAPPFSNIEKLHLGALLTFSRVPSWTSNLRSLCDLKLWVKEIPCEDVDIIGKLPFLAKLYLGIPGVPTERILIRGSTGLFAVLKHFGFRCDGPSCLTFEAGAMPNLRKLLFTVSPREWDEATPVGLEHLSMLKEIQLISKYSMQYRNIATPKDIKRGRLWKAFEEAANALPSRPTFYNGKTYVELEE